MILCLIDCFVVVLLYSEMRSKVKRISKCIIYYYFYYNCVSMLYKTNDVYNSTTN